MRYGVSCICFALALLLLGGSSASAGPLEDTVSTVTSSLPDLSTAPIQSSLPEAPAAPTVRVDVPASTVADPPPAEISPVRSGGGAPSGPQAIAGSQSGDAGPVRIATGSADLAAGTAGAAGTTGGLPANGSPRGPAPTDGHARRHAVDPAHPAPFRRWLARVWPAIALGPFGGPFTAPGPSGGLWDLLSTTAAHRLHAILGAGGEGGVSAAHSEGSADSGSPFSGADAGQAGGLRMSLLVLLLASGTLGALLFLALALGAGFPPRRLG